MANLKYIGKNILNHTLEVKKGNVSGSSTSTGSFGRLTAAGNIHGTSFVGTNLYGTIGTAAQNSITSATSLTSVGTVTSGIWNSTFGATSNKSISGSWRGELSSSNMTVIGGGVSGSSSSTGSFGRVISKTLNATSNVDISGNLTVAGNYIVNGTTTFISSSQLEIGDNIIQVNSVNPLNYGGIHVRDKNSNETGSMVWDSANDYWVAGQSGSEYRVPLQSGTSNLTDNKVIIAQGSGRLESGNITDTGASISMTLPVTASSNLEVIGNISGSSTSTGSFGKLTVGQGAPYDNANLTVTSDTAQVSRFISNSPSSTVMSSIRVGGVSTYWELSANSSGGGSGATLFYNRANPNAIQIGTDRASVSRDLELGHMTAGGTAGVSLVADG
ncbi:MAG: hypothetical protein CBD58_00395, partial [bacterium TMED198]